MTELAVIGGNDVRRDGKASRVDGGHDGLRVFLPSEAGGETQTTKKGALWEDYFRQCWSSRCSKAILATANILHTV